MRTIRADFGLLTQKIPHANLRFSHRSGNLELKFKLDKSSIGQRAFVVAGIHCLKSKGKI
jgi:hypothetical protein